MASIFLSYAREDAARAERIAGALDSAGYSVWWDRHVNAGSRFSKEIDAALRSAELVMVLWSKSSVDSAWVQDEAAAGRDSGRLVPVLLDRIEPPLGFRQYHAIDLSGRTRGPRSIEPLLRAIAQRVGNKAAGPRAAARAPQSRMFAARRTQAGAALAILLVAAGAWWLVSSRSDPRSLVVVANDPDSKAFASDIAGDLSSFKLGPLARLQVRMNDGGHARYKAVITLTRAGSQSEVRLGFGPRSAPALWTATLNGSAAQESDLRLQATQQLGAVLGCAIDPKVTAAGLSNDVLQRYLNGCARMVSFSDQIDPAAIENFRQVTLELPKFAPAWGQLELAEYRALITAPGPQQREIAFRARAAWQEAMALDPTLPQNFIVHAFVYPVRPGYLPRALGIIEEGLRLNPDNALLLSTRADLLASVGRLKDAFESARDAIWRDPLSPNLLTSDILLLVYTGQKHEAENELIQAERKWPGASAVQSARFSFDLRYGNPDHALQLLLNHKGATSDVQAQASPLALYLEARKEPTPARVEMALNAFRAQFRQNHEDPLQLIQALATFNRNDEVFQVLSRPESIDEMAGNTDLFFRPYFEGVRGDPRFMELASRVGLVAYWRKANSWPDFCSDPKLRYDCRKEAAKYR